MKIVISPNNAWCVAPLALLKEFLDKKGIKYYPVVQNIDYDSDKMAHFLSDIEDCDMLSSAPPDEKGDLPKESGLYLENYRTDPILIEMVESSQYKGTEGFELKVVEIPDNVNWYIDHGSEFDEEVITEKHRTWR